jgi:hypothetical protein
VRRFHALRGFVRIREAGPREILKEWYHCSFDPLLQSPDVVSANTHKELAYE